jgi:hypothetical protein
MPTFLRKDIASWSRRTKVFIGECGREGGREGWTGRKEGGFEEGERKRKRERTMKKNTHMSENEIQL